MSKHRSGLFAPGWGVLLLFCFGAEPARGAEPHAEPSEEHSILVDRPFLAESVLELAPGASAYTSLFEANFLPATSLIEESGGFSIIDPELLAIHGASARWTAWTYAGIDVSDPYFAGAAAFHVPAPLLRALGVRYAETPSTLAPEGPALEPRSPFGVERGRARLELFAPNAGGYVAPARAIMRLFSGSHPTERELPPPTRERRGFVRRLGLDAIERVDLPFGALLAAFEVDAGARRYLEFAAPNGDLESTFEEPFALASAGFVLEPTHGRWRGHAVLEHRQRRHLFAELHHAKAETVALSATTLFLGLEHGPLRAGATTKVATLRHSNPDFSRELLDPDGESFRPFSPDGLVVASNLDLTHRLGPVFFRSNQKISAFFPRQATTTNALFLEGVPYGRLDSRSRDTASIVGDEQVGVLEQLEFGALRLDLSLSFSLAFAINTSLENTLFLPDVGAKAALALPEVLGLEPFLALARTPLPIPVDLARRLDPDFFSSEERLADGRLIDTTGGASFSVAPRLRRAHIASAALGFRARPFEGWRLSVQGLGRIFGAGYWASFEGGADAAGTVIDDRFYLSEGPKRYVLGNYPFDRPPFFMGFEIQLLRQRTDRFFFDVSFSALNAIGRTAFGNGATANDLGVVDESMANPNSSVRGLANLDADRAFLLKLLLAYRVIDGLWFSFSARHKDGQPFAFFDVATEGGQLARLYASPRGSPLKYTRPLAGPREDFQLEMSVGVRYDFAVSDLPLTARFDALNVLDFGNELQERSSRSAQSGRSALELQIPRALALSLEASL